MKTFTFMSLLLLTSISFAGLTTVSTDGATVDSAPYLLQTQGSSESYHQNLDSLKNDHSLDQQSGNLLHSLYPVKSTFTQGDVTPQYFNSPHLMRPIFVVGDDEVSIDWLQRNAKALKSLKALGIITNVQSEVRVKAIIDLTGVEILPASLEGIEPLVHTNHYPLLWTQDGVSQ